ncbi:Oidioi.mRNA.OKI2018_I69.chr1.g2746.t1.cds [Oikopleura dioica]|uniref:Oidioi.mRNA.OKI2018_I69.chr1.g2746.t1.cds n=1 Tax=Oikopleura dioica TaxID=34765 RepID=A0ABN7SSM5_OIKDI|nr:Oidioi.mRNA.OKI2018_I69.chr1.g2746.t1.cds [Oikopleura dioica]
MKLFRLLLLALGILGKNAEEENGDGKVTHNASDVQKLNELRRAILDAQNLISSLSSEEISENIENEIKNLKQEGIIDQVVETAAEIIKEGKSEDELIDELVTLKKIGSFGNFDQITIERDHEGSMIITKTQRVSESNSQVFHEYVWDDDDEFTH